MSDLSRKTLKLIASPVTYFIDRRGKRRNEERTSERAPSNSDPAVLRTRDRRPLTPPLSKPADFDNQVASSLLQTIPPELRLLIWDRCFEGRVHLVWRMGHIQSFSCLLLPDTDDYSLDTHQWCVRARQDAVNVVDAGKRKDRKQARGLLAPVLTCRRIYAETISLLYAIPIFDLPSTYLCLVHLPSLILPSRLHAISTVNFVWECMHWPPAIAPQSYRSWKLDHFAQSWLAVWSTLAGMQGLKKLRVEIAINPVEARSWMNTEDQIFESLSNMRKLENFELVLHWPEAGGLRLKEIDCTVVRKISDRAYLG